MAEKTYRDAIRDAMMEEMDRDPNVLVMGEDIGVYEGTFRITAGMLKKYGPRRVIDTPIAEAGMAGTALGMSMLGLRPIVEMMTMNFAIVAADQILNHAAKVRYFSGGQVDIPMVIRGPQGAGVQLSAQHSQTFEALYGHFPGIKVATPATPADAKGLLKTAIRDDNPVVFIEDKMDYTVKGEVPEGELEIPLGVADVKRAGEDVTIVATSSMVRVALAAAEQLESEGISAEVIDPRTLVPLDRDALVASAQKTGRAIVVDEGHRRYGATAELAAVIADRAFYSLDAPVKRLGALDVPVPFAPTLEDVTVPTPELVAQTARELCGK